MYTCPRDGGDFFFPPCVVFEYVLKPNPGDIWVLAGEFSRSKDRKNRQIGRPKRNQCIDLDLYIWDGRKEIANICRSCHEEGI